jgi:hypothetical protein
MGENSMICTSSHVSGWELPWSEDCTHQVTDRRARSNHHGIPSAIPASIHKAVHFKLFGRKLLLFLFEQFQDPIGDTAVDQSCPQDGRRARQDSCYLTSSRSDPV